MGTSVRNAVGKRAERARVPGFSVVRWQGSNTRHFSGGVTSAATGVGVTPDTLFLIGSVAKLYTATIVGRLASQGMLDLDAELGAWLREFRRGEPITLRSLLSHTSGLDGDLYVEGRGRTGVASYVSSLADLPRIAGPGEIFSYANSGYVALGAVIDAVTGNSWEEALQAHIVEPLGLTHTVAEADRLPFFRVAVGHGADGSPVTRFFATETQAAAGTTLAASAGDVMSFLREAAAIVGPEMARTMQTAAVHLPAGSAYPAWGLGWKIFPHAPGVIGHDGMTSGQYARVRYRPETDEGCVALANGGDARTFIEQVFALLAPDLETKVSPPKIAAPARPLKDYAGSYGKVDSTLHVTVHGDRLCLEVARAHDPLGTVEEMTLRLAPTGGDSFWALRPGGGFVEPVCFVPSADDRIGWAHAHGRAFRRI